MNLVSVQRICRVARLHKESAVQVSLSKITKGEWKVEVVVVASKTNKTSN